MLAVDLSSPFSFFSSLKSILDKEGYHHEGEGVYVIERENHSFDWLSISGNPYFFVANFGVSFPFLTKETFSLMPKFGGSSPLRGVKPRAVPLVFIPLSELASAEDGIHYGDGLTRLSKLDLEALYRFISKRLPDMLRPMHNLKVASQMAMKTLGRTQYGPYLLVLAYVKLGDVEEARSFAGLVLDNISEAQAKRHFFEFIQNVQKSLGLDLDV